MSQQNRFSFRPRNPGFQQPPAPTSGPQPRHQNPHMAYQHPPPSVHDMYQQQQPPPPPQSERPANFHLHPPLPPHQFTRPPPMLPERNQDNTNNIGHNSASFSGNYIQQPRPPNSDNFHAYSDRNIPSFPQQNESAFFPPPRSRETGQMNYSLPPPQIQNQVRNVPFNNPVQSYSCPTSNFQPRQPLSIQNQLPGTVLMKTSDANSTKTSLGCQNLENNQLETIGHPGLDKLNEWLQIRQKKHQEKERGTTNRCRPMQVQEAKTLLLEGYNLLKQLEDVTQSSLPEENQTQMAKLHKIVNQLSKNSVRQLARRLEYRKHKRVLRRKREQVSREDVLSRREELHATIDAQRNAKQEKILHAEREEKMKKNADTVLTEVKKKLTSSKKALSVLKNLKKLRQIRKDNANKKGFHVPSECDELFESRVSSTIEMLEKQHHLYVGEEQTLQVMLETEHEQTREAVREAVLVREDKRRKRKQKRFLKSLFGDEYWGEVDDPLCQFYHYYTQADSDMNSLIQIRNQWDAYLVPDGSVFGSSIPLGWIPPVAPSNHVWASVLTHNEALTS